MPSLRYGKTVGKPLEQGYPINPQTIGEHVRKKRMDLGLYQTDVGRMLKVSKDCVTNWELGRNAPLVSYYPRIISFLGYNPIAIDESTVAGKVFAYRCAYGLSQKKLAKMLGVDPTTVKAWETETNVTPSKLTLAKIRALFLEAR